RRNNSRQCSFTFTGFRHISLPPENLQGRRCTAGPWTIHAAPGSLQAKFRTPKGSSIFRCDGRKNNLRRSRCEVEFLRQVVTESATTPARTPDFWSNLCPSTVLFPVQSQFSPNHGVTFETQRTIRHLAHRTLRRATRREASSAIRLNQRVKLVPPCQLLPSM